MPYQSTNPPAMPLDGTPAKLHARAELMLAEFQRDAEKYRLAQEAKRNQPRPKKRHMSTEECIKHLFEKGSWPDPAQRAGYR